MKELSIIIPVVNEYPAIVQTLGNVEREIADMSAEIIVVDNADHSCLSNYNTQPLAKDLDVSMFRGLRLVEYRGKRSPWAAMTFGAEKAEGKVLLFLDAHCNIKNLKATWEHYKEAHIELNGPVFLPIRENNRVKVGRLNTDGVKDGELFLDSIEMPIPDGVNNDTRFVFPVPGGPVCGCMLTSDMFVCQLEGFPGEMGIRRGGNEYLSFVLRLMGRKMWASTIGYVEHTPSRRRYTFDWGDMVSNALIAAYLFGGESWVKKYTKTLEKRMRAKREKNIGLATKIQAALLKTSSLGARRDAIEKAATKSLTAVVSDIQAECPELVSKIYSTEKKSTKKATTKKKAVKKTTTRKRAKKGANI